MNQTRCASARRGSGAATTESITKTIRDHFEMDDVLVLVYTTASETAKQLEGL